MVEILVGGTGGFGLGFPTCRYLLPNLLMLPFEVVSLVGLLFLLKRGVGRNNRFAFRVRPEFALAVVTIFLGIAAFELGLRCFMFQSFPDFRHMERQTLGYEHDPELGWFPAPHSHRAVDFNRPTFVAHNSRGFRDPEPSFDARPRVVFLGDSFVWGYNVNADERFTEKLRNRHPEWQIYNFGVVGYATDQEYLLLQRQFKQYQPKIVFLVFCTENDFIDNCNNGGGMWAFKPYFTVESNGLKLHGVPVPLSDWVFCKDYPVLSKSYLVRLAVRAWGNLRSPHPPRFERAPTIALLKALHRYVLEHGAVFCVGFTDKDQELEHFLRDSRIPSVDLSNNLRVEGDYHWSPEGHSFVADKIERFLLSQGLLSKTGLAGVPIGQGK